MTAAFKGVDEFGESFHMCPDDVEEDVDPSHGPQLDLRSMDNFDSFQELNKQIMKNLGVWNHAELARNGCMAHLLQLAIKDAIKLCELVKLLLKKCKQIVNFFAKSSRWKDELKKETGGLTLVKSVEVRWNSDYKCLKRILRKDDKVASHVEFNHIFIYCIYPCYITIAIV